MKLPVLLTFAMLASACNPTTAALVSGDPMGALDLAAGQGTVLRSQDGKDRFRYVFGSTHLNGLVEPALQEQTRMDYIGAFVGRSSICPSGWNIDQKSTVDGFLIYEGSCRG